MRLIYNSLHSLVMTVYRTRLKMLAGIIILILTLSPAFGAFVHPGLYYTANDLAFMRKKIDSKAEPWFSAWEHGVKSQNVKCTPHATAEWDATKEGYMGSDPLIAHKEALQWALTGDPAHAANAIAILNAWSSTLQKIVPHAMPQEMLAIGWNGAHFANAAELLCYANPNGKSSGWKAEDIQQFKKMLRLYYSVIEKFKSNYNGNWDAAMMNTMACMGIFLDDQAMFDRAVKHAIEGEKPNGGLANYISSTGQCQESGRDAGHVQMGVGNFVALCEVAWKQGVDLYGAHDNRLRAGVEYTAQYMLGNDVPFDPQFGQFKTISDQGRGLFTPIYEAAYQHYVYRKGLEMPFTKQVIFNGSVKVNGRNKNTPGPYRNEGSSLNTGLCWGTLTMFKGEEDPQALKKLPPSANGLPVKKEASK